MVPDTASGIESDFSDIADIIFPKQIRCYLSCPNLLIKMQFKRHFSLILRKCGYQLALNQLIPTLIETHLLKSLTKMPYNQQASCGYSCIETDHIKRLFIALPLSFIFYHLSVSISLLMGLSYTLISPQIFFTTFLPSLFSVELY